jgi:CelD/BcsL family acetyltransferase involved in cellulose biosynthesis
LPDYSVSACIVGEFGEFGEFGEIGPEWLDLQARSDASWFQSWGWVNTWLEQVVPDLRPMVVRVHAGERLVGLGLFVPRDIKRHVLVRSRALFLNEYPFDGRNMVIEYNGLLAECGFEDAVYAQTAAWLVRNCRDRDEFHFSAIPEGAALDGLKNAAPNGTRCIVNETSVAWSVNLDRLEPGLDAYLDTLSKNRRGQVRRSLRLYGEHGLPEIVEAHDVEEALAFFEALEELHTGYWRSRGRQGSFANPRWRDFHRSIITSHFADNEIQLLKITGSGETIGYIYSALWRGQVYVLQTGFRTRNDKRYQPGYVAHALAIEYNKAREMAVYDLMHGDSLYKRILCDRRTELNWIVLQRPRLKFVLEDLAVGIVRRCRALAG